MFWDGGVCFLYSELGSCVFFNLWLVLLFFMVSLLFIWYFKGEKLLEGEYLFFNLFDWKKCIYYFRLYF